MFSPELIKKLAQQIMRPSPIVNDAKRMLLIKQLSENHPALVEAELARDEDLNIAVFLGFLPDPSVDYWSSPNVRVFPRSSVIEDDEKILKLINQTRALIKLHTETSHKLFRPTVYYDNGFYKADALIQWYSPLTDEVSLLFPINGAYTVMQRKELPQNADR
jgi:hypothetical protein